MLNGNTIELGVCYYPEHWDTSFWKEDMLRMKSYGIGVIRVAEFAWNLFEPEEGHFDDSFWDRFFKCGKGLRDAGHLLHAHRDPARLADGKIPGSIKL